jgi:membrane protease YdiL (CAAX protease family)
VSTEESSQQITPLSEQPHADPPATVLGEAVQPIPTTPNAEWWLSWLEVLKAGGLWIVSVLLLIFVPVLVALPYMIYVFVKSGAPSPEAIQSDKTLIFLSVLGIIPTHILTLVAVWIVVTAGGKRPFWKTLGFEWPENMNRKLGALVSVGVAIALLGLAWLVTKLYGGEKTQLDLLIESSLPARFATAFVAVATAPLVEEIVYRGVLYPAVEKVARLTTRTLNPALEGTAGMVVAIAFVSLLFAGVHVFQYYNNLAVITVITILSITLTVARAITGKVLPSFIIHLVFNGIQSVILALAPFVEK